MCTAVSYKTKNHYFGRTLDYDVSYHENVVITPRNYPFHFRRAGKLDSHYAMIGMAAVMDDYPLYYEASNEKGLSMAGLNFSGNAHYEQEAEEKDNLAPFEFIPWVLGQCSDLNEARRLLDRIRLVDIPFRDDLPLAELHWMISDRNASVTVESVRGGFYVYENPVGVMTNNPPFDMQLLNLADYMNLSPDPPDCRFAKDLELLPYSRGMGAMGLPGDLSSMSRFVKAAFTKLNSVSGDSESESVNQFFHILGAVEQQRGCVRMENGAYEVTLYTCCCNTDRGIYYYTTYENRRITAVDMHRENPDGRNLIVYPLMTDPQIYMQNA